MGTRQVPVVRAAVVGCRSDARGPSRGANGIGRSWIWARHRDPDPLRGRVTAPDPTAVRARPAGAAHAPGSRRTARLRAHAARRRTWRSAPASARCPRASDRVHTPARRLGRSARARAARPSVELVESGRQQVASEVAAAAHRHRGEARASAPSRRARLPGARRPRDGRRGCRGRPRRTRPARGARRRRGRP